MVHRQRAAGIVPSLEVAEGFEGTQDDMLALRPARSRFGYNNATRVTPVCWGNLIVTIPASRSRVTSNECARGGRAWHQLGCEYRSISHVWFGALDTRAPLSLMVLPQAQQLADLQK